MGEASSDKETAEGDATSAASTSKPKPVTAGRSQELKVKKPISRWASPNATMSTPVAKPSQAKAPRKARARVTRNKGTEAARPKATQPMKGPDYTNRALFWYREPDVAAYLGFSDLGTFRQLLLSFPVLESYIVWREHSNCHQANKVFALLEHTRERDMKEKFPVGISEILAKYGKPEGEEKSTEQKEQTPVEVAAESTRVKHVLACLLRRLVEETNNALSDSEDSKQGSQVVESWRFEKKFNVRFPSSHDIMRAEGPFWGPIERTGEIEAEKFNRAFNLLKRLHYIMSGDRWEAQFGTKSDPFEHKSVPADATPLWMVLPIGEDDPIIPQQLPELEQHNFKLVRDITKTAAQDDLDDLFEDHLQPQSLRFPEGTERCAFDPRIYPTREEWLDTIRNQLDFRRLRIQFLTVRLELKSNDGPAQSHLVYGKGKKNTWSELQDLMKSTPEGDVLYNIKALAEGESPLEYKGVPLALLDNVMIDDGGEPSCKPLPHEGTTTASNQLEEKTEISSQEVPSSNTYSPDALAKARMEAFLAGVSGTNTQRQFSMPADLFNPGTQRSAAMREYSDHEVFTVEGLKKWQLAAIEHALTLDDTEPATATKSGRPGRRLTLSDGKKGKKKQTVNLSEQLRDEIVAAEKAQSEAMLTSDDPEFDAERHIQVNSAFSGNDAQTGLGVKESRLLFGMTKSGQFQQDKTLDLCKTGLFDITNSEFLDHQTSGAAWMVQKSLGFVPRFYKGPDPPPAGAEDAFHAYSRGQCTHGGILGDGTGMGKTRTAGLFMTAFSEYTARQSKTHRPMLLLAPSGPLFKQWQDDVYHRFPGLQIIVGNDDKPTSEHMRPYWVSKAAMEAAPHDLSQWPEHLKYVFDTQDPRASRTLFMVPYETWTIRSLEKGWEEPNETNKWQAEWSDDHQKDMIVKYTTRFQDVFGAVICDEGHRLRHDFTNLHVSVEGLKSPVNWFLTATPQLNHAKDIIGLLEIMWPSVKSAMIESASEEDLNWLEESDGSKEPWAVFETVQTLPKENPLRNIVLDPKRVSKLFDTAERQGDHLLVSRYFSYTKEAVMIQRTTSSQLTPSIFDQSEGIPLKGLMPEHTVKTVEVSYNAAEAAEAQFLHRMYAREYEIALETGGKQKRKRSGHNRSGTTQQRFAPVGQSLRRLNIASSSTLLSRLDLTMRNRGLDTLVDDMRGYRANQHNVDWFISETRRPSDLGLPIDTRANRLKYLCWGSPKLRLLLRQVRDVVLGQNTKLLITEDTPIVAWFFELVLQFLHVECYVMHADLSNQERQELVERFNDKNSTLKVLILMYNISAQGVNLHKAAYHAFVATGAINAGVEIQAWGRLIRIGQEHRVEIVRCQTTNSHDQFRDAKQREKQKLILAASSRSPAMDELLVELLNRGNEEVRQAHSSPIAELIRKRDEERALIGGLDDDLFEANDLEFDGDFPLSKTVKDAMDISIDTDDAPGRTSRASRMRRSSPLLDEGFLEDDKDEDFIDDEENDDVDTDYYETDDERELGSERADTTFDDAVLKTAKQQLKKMTRHDREAYDQSILNLTVLLSLDPERVYYKVDLEHPNIFERALTLLYRAKFGQTHEHVRLTPHVRYDALHPDIAKRIDDNVRDYEFGLIEKDKKKRRPTTAPHKSAGKKRKVEETPGPPADPPTDPPAGPPAGPSAAKKRKTEDPATSDMTLTMSDPGLPIGKSTTAKMLKEAMDKIGASYGKGDKKGELETKLCDFQRAYTEKLTGKAVAAILTQVGVVHTSGMPKKTLLALWKAWIAKEDKGPKV